MSFSSASCIIEMCAVFFLRLGDTTAILGRACVTMSGSVQWHCQFFPSTSLE